MELIEGVYWVNGNRTYYKDGQKVYTGNYSEDDFYSFEDDSIASKYEESLHSYRYHKLKVIPFVEKEK